MLSLKYMIVLYVYSYSYASRGISCKVHMTMLYTYSKSIKVATLYVRIL